MEKKTEYEMGNYNAIYGYIQGYVGDYRGYGLNS